MGAGGRGTRLAPYTTVFPKPLMPIGEMPVLEILLRRLAAAGFRRAHLAVGQLAELIEAYFGDGKRFGVELRYWREDEPLGTAGPLARIEFDAEPILVMNGDLLTTLDFRALVASHAESGAWATVGTPSAPSFAAWSRRGMRAPASIRWAIGWCAASASTPAMRPGTW